MLREVGLLLTLITSNAYAVNVYKCQEGDKVIYSQMPCEVDNSRNSQLDYSHTQNYRAQSAPEPKSSSPAKKSVSPERYILSKKRQRVIARINTLKRNYNNETDAIKEQGYLVGNNRSGDNLLTNLINQLNAKRDDYFTKVAVEEKELAKIDEEIKKLAK